MHSHFLTLRSTARIALVLLICAALLPVQWIPLVVSVFAQGQRQAPGRTGRPRPGKPEGELPNLENVKSESGIERKAPPPIPSTMRSPKTPLQPWNGRRVGDSEIGSKHAVTGQRLLASARRNQPTRRAHARRHLAAPPTISDDQFVQNFFNWALVRTPSSDELTFWNDQLRVAYVQGAESVKLAAVAAGKTLFESAQYAARNRDNHWYVYDLYKTFLMRDPDPSGWAYWESLLPSMGRENVRRGFEESTELATLMAGIVPNGSATANAASLISARVDPHNQPGHGMLARDATWSVPLLSLPGRAGLDLGLSLSYSSMVWTRSGPYIHFDEDNGSPSPGFRLGFPTVQRKVFNAQTAKNAYLLISAAGHRVELRQIGSSNVYEAGDSSYLQLTDNGTYLIVRSTDGTQLRLTEINNEYRCTQVKDRNGNYISVNYNAVGQITTIVDTLNREIVFNYDGNGNLLSITQNWNGQPSHQWVSFGWATRPLQHSFTGAKVVGTPDNTTLPVITQVALNDGSHFTFDYTNALQVSVIKNYSGTIERNATSFTYDTPAGEAPRLVSSSVSARNWSGINGVPAQVTTRYSVATDGAGVMTAPDGTVYREYYGTGWQRGLTTRSEVWLGTQLVKWTTAAWTQDNASVGYEMNPRVTETNIYDMSGNRRRTVIDYGPYSQYGLPYGVREFAADGETEIRQTYTDYNLSPAYLERRIIGLISYVHVSNVAQWQSKISYSYDDPARLQALPASATQHDSDYSTAFTARGNVSSVSLWDVTDISNTAKKLTSYTNYYTTGTPSVTTDPAGHLSSISYADSFSDNVVRNTFAYPTTITDAGNFSSTVQYNFDFGAPTRTQSPAPAGQSQGAIQTMTYNSLGQLERITAANNNAYKRFWYGPDYTASYATVNSVSDELYAIEVVDGLGRVIGTAGNHPGSYGGFRLVVSIYDLLGRTWKVSNPTEVNNSWVPSGDDGAGMYLTTQSYDWKGRPLVTTNADGTTKQVSYAGCGCAGGEVLTLTDEVGRRQKIYMDVLGRQIKGEVLNGSDVYSTTLSTYNVLDQVTSLTQYQGDTSSGIYQSTTMSYDGYGRLISQHDPEQAPGQNTTFSYNADGQQLTSTDARGATTTYSYNARHLVSGIVYSAPAGVHVPGNVTFTYDGAGNRTGMTDGLGSASYQYDQLSRMTSETRRLNDLPSAPVPNNAYTISYSYNLAGALLTIADPFGKQVSYTRDSVDRLNSLSRPGYGGNPDTMSGVQYRAWGKPKQVILSGNGQATTVSYEHDSRMAPSRFQVTPQNGGTTYGAQYQRYADGQVSYAQDLADPKFDRAYSYDQQMGRVTQGLSGAEARGSSTADGPYKQTYGYDAFSNVTTRSGRHWTQNTGSQSATFVNNRNTLWQYDVDGRPTQAGTQTFRYDAAGRQINSSGTAVQMFDGDGRRIKNATINPVNFELRSSVLGGQIINYLFANGEHGGGAVYADGAPIGEAPWDLNGPLHWQLHSPINSGVIDVMLGIIVQRDKEFSPIGDGVGVENPYVSGGGGSGLGYPASGGDPSSMRCAFDGFEADCTSVFKFVIRRNFYTIISSMIEKRFATSITNNRAVLVPGGSHGGDVVYGTAGEDGTPSSVEIIGEPDRFEIHAGTDLIGLRVVTTITTQVLPKKRQPLPTDLKDRVAKIVNNPETDCAEFIKKLIGNMKGAFSDDPMKLFERVEKEKGFTLGNTGKYAGVSDMPNGKRQVRIRPVGSTADSRLSEHQAYAYAMTALNELMHHARDSGLYLDRELAIGISKLLSRDELAAHPLPKTNDVETNSTYFHSLFKLHCRSLTGE